MNFAYNYINHLKTLEGTLIQPFIDRSEAGLSYEIKQYRDRTEKLFFMDDDSDYVCKIVQTDNSIMYYEKANKD